MYSIGVLSSMLNETQKTLFRFGGPILMFISTFGCLLNLIVFTQHHLRKNPCAICFIALNIVHILYTIFSLIPAILQIGYNIDPSAYNLIYCRFRYYSAFIFVSFERFYLILASLDRVLITSSKFQIRKWSNPYFISICICIITLFWILFHSHALIHTNTVQYNSNNSICISNSGIYSIFISYYSLIFNGIIPPLIMIIFGLLTIRNIRRVRRIGITVVTNTHETIPNSRILHGKERQMIIMLLVELFIYIIFSCMSPIYLLYKQITQYELKTNEKQIIEQFIATILLFILFIPYSLNFYVNLLVSKTFRVELKKIFQLIKIYICRQLH